MLGVCGCFRSQASSGASFHSSWIELTSLVANLSISVSLINPTMLAWLSFVYPWLRESLLVFSLFLVEIMPNSGVAVLLRD